MQVGSALTAGGRSSGWTRTAARARPSDSLPLPGPQKSLTTGSISTPHGGAYATNAIRTARAVPETTSWAASSTLRTIPWQGRQHLVKDASPHSATERTCGGMEHGTPRTSAERASCASGTARPTRSTNGWRFTTQGRRRRPATYQRERWTPSNTRSRWHGQWGKTSHNSGWNYRTGRWS